MSKLTTLTTSRASWCARGEYRHRRCFFAPFHERIKIAQKVVHYPPTEKRLDGLLGMRCGAKTIAQRTVTIKVDPAVQRAFGRKGWAEQSTIARPLPAGTAENVAQLERVSRHYLKRDGATPRPPVHQALLWVDVDVTPLPMGAKAEGSERAWMGRHRRKTGRKTLRLSARAYREILHETLRRGKASAVPALQAARRELEARLGWTRESRQRIVSRLDGGFATTAVLNGLLSLGSQVGAQIRQSGRVRKWRQPVGPWQPTSSAGRERAEVLAPRRFCRKTRPWVIRTPKDKGGYPEAVLVTTVLDLQPMELADAYDGRAMIEATFCQDTQGLGLVKRRQHTWEAQQVVVLLARLAPHLLRWSQRWLRRVPAIRWRLRGYGVVRWLQEVWTVPGRIRRRRGWMVSGHFEPLHPRAKPLPQGFATRFRGRVRVYCLR
jgi:Transposase DDE domain group 1